MIESSLTHQGFRYHYRLVRGERRRYAPTMFIGGAFQTMRSLAKFAEVFSASTDVILVDLPGSGASDPLPTGYGGDFLADCVRRLLDHLEIRRANLVGVSFGTAIAHATAQNHPGRVDDLVLVGTMSRMNRRIRHALRRALAAMASNDVNAFTDRVCRVLLNYGKRDRIPRFRRAERLLRAAISRMTEREMEQFRVSSQRLLVHRSLDMSRPLQPRTLVFTGEHDTVTTPACCRQVAATGTEAYSTVVHGGDHLVPLEQFETCVGLVEMFLGGGPVEDVPGCASLERVGCLALQALAAPAAGRPIRLPGAMA